MSNVDGAGLYSGAFFVGKAELLKWLNDFFQIGYTRVEDCASGAIHCQILDSIFPGKVPLHKVNFNAKYEHEFIPNYKVLQAVFDAQGLKKYVDVDKLIKAKYQDNLEFLQWMKHLWDSRYNNQEYDAVARRGKKGAAPAKGIPSAVKKVETKAKPAPAAKPKTVTKPTSAAKKPAAKKHDEDEDNAEPPAADDGGATAAQVEHLNQKLTKLRLTIEGLEKERNFYFGKLREIEVLCQTDEEKDAETKAKVLEILYKTDEDFAQPSEEAAQEEAPAEEEEAPAQEEELDDDGATY